MKLSFRLEIALIVIGAGIAYLGHQEIQVSDGASERPQQVKLEELEAGQVPDNTHLEIAPHWRMDRELVFRYETKKGETGDPPPTAKVKYAYYPIVSDSHPYIRKMRNLETLYGSVEAIPAEQLPAVDDFAVLVKTRRYRTVGALPEPAWSEGEAVRGLVVNRINELRPDERELLAESFPKLSFGRIVILEEGRQPASAAYAFGLLAGGAGLGLAGLGLMVLGRRKPTGEAQPAAPQSPASQTPHRPRPIG
jgi:hypothetical protein